MKMKVLVLLAMIISLGASEVLAADYSGNSSGVFVNPFAGPSNPAMTVTGVGTSNFTWGNGSAFGSPPSSLVFSGTPFSGNFEQEFKFGNLRYYNGTIAAGTGADAVDLLTTLAFTTPSGITQNFSFNFQLINTPNVADPVASADYVKLDQLFDPSSSFTYNGNIYFLQFTRFEAQDSFGFNSNATEFHVYENSGGVADLYGKITTSPVPEPSTFILFGAGLAGLGFLRRRSKK